MIVSLWYADRTFVGLIHPPPRTFISRTQGKITFFLSYYKLIHHQSLVCRSPPCTTPLPAFPSFCRVILGLGATRISKKSSSLLHLPGNHPTPHERDFIHNHIHLLSFLAKNDDDDDDNDWWWWWWALLEWWGIWTVKTCFAGDSDEQRLPTSVAVTYQPSEKNYLEGKVWVEKEIMS